MNAFDKVFEQAIDDGILEYNKPIEKEILRSIHNLEFNTWLAKTFEIEITQENYSTLCTHENFKKYLKEYYAEEKKVQAEKLLSKIENKMDVGLIPHFRKMLPDIDLVVKDSEYYLPMVEPHYSMFLEQINRGGIVNVKEYINTIFYSIAESLDVEGLIKHFDSNPLPQNDEEVKELAQTVFAKQPFNTNADSFRKVKEMAEKIGEIPLEDGYAFHTVNVVILKLLINRIVILGTSRLEKSFTKQFLLQYYSEYCSIINKPIPIELVEHINNIRVPNFDIALKEFLEEKKLTLPERTKVKDEPTTKINQQNITAQNVNNFFSANNAPIAQSSFPERSEKGSFIEKKWVKYVILPIVVTIIGGLILWWVTK